jgi:imidazolonepropionase-like amidohydrolase
MTKLVCLAVVLASCLTFTGAAAALQGEPGKLVVKAGTIVTLGGDEIRNGAVVVENGRIVAVGTDVEIPYDATVLEFPDKVLFPGMVNCHDWGGLDRPNESIPVAPFLDVADALDPSSVDFEEDLRQGVTTVGVSQGHDCIIGGMGRAVRPLGLTPPEMTVKQETGLKISVAARRRSNRMIQMSQLRQAFHDLDEYTGQVAEKKYEDDLKKKDKKIEVGPDEAREKGKALLRADDLDDKHRNLYRLTTGAIGSFVYAEKAMDVKVAIDLARERGFFDRMTLVVGSECFKAAATLKEAGRPVILTELVHREQDPWTGEIEETFVPGVLAREGVRFALLPEGGSLGARYLWYQAARCVRNGVTRQTALESITLVPAEALGLRDRVGSIEVGKDANLVVLSGDPLDSLTWVEKVFIEGRLAYDKDKDIRLLELLEGLTRDEIEEGGEAMESPEDGASGATPEVDPETDGGKDDGGTEGDGSDGGFLSGERRHAG